MARVDKHMKLGEYEREVARRNRGRIRRWRKIHLIALIAILVVSAVIISNLFSDKKKIRRQGVDAYEAGQYQEAIAYFDEAYAKKQWFSDSVDVDILLYKADSYMRLQQFTEAEELLAEIAKNYSTRNYDEKQLQYMQDIAHALNNFHQGDYVSTVAAFNDAVADGHKDMSIYAALCYENQSNYEKMREYLDIYSQYHGMDSYLYYKYAAYFYQIKDYAQAVAFLNQGEQCSDTAYLQEIQYAKIMCYKEMKDFPLAYSLAQAYVQSYPMDTKGADILAYLDTRVNIDDRPINDKFHVLPENQADNEAIAE